MMPIALYGLRLTALDRGEKSNDSYQTAQCLPCNALQQSKKQSGKIIKTHVLSS
jgi:hypothetical protein